MTDTPTVWVKVETNSAAESPSYTGERNSTTDTGYRFGAPETVPTPIERVVASQRIPLDAKMLKEQMAGLLAVVDDLFEQASQQSQMSLDELQLSVEIDGEGKVSLVGNGVKLASSGGITMKFKAKQ